MSIYIKSFFVAVVLITLLPQFAKCQDTSQIGKFCQVFWQNKTASKTVKDRYEARLMAIHSDDLDERTTETKALVAAEANSLKFALDSTLNDLCEKVEIDRMIYDSIAYRYYTEPRFQTQIYPLLIRHVDR